MLKNPFSLPQCLFVINMINITRSGTLCYVLHLLSCDFYIKKSGVAADKTCIFTEFKDDKS